MAAIAVMSVGTSKTIIMKKDEFMKKYTRTIAPRRSGSSSGSSSSGSSGSSSSDDEDNIVFKRGVNIQTLCSKQIDRDWVIDTLVDDEPSHVAIIIDGNKAIRGICIFNISGRGNKKSCYIHLICRAPVWRGKTRANVERKRGKDIMLDIMEFAKSKKCKTVKLSALNHVVGYYYKLGFRFPNKRARYSDDDILTAARSAAMIENMNDGDITYNELPRPLRARMHGMYAAIADNEGRQALNNEDYEGLEERVSTYLSNGIKMVYTYPKKKRTSVKRGKAAVASGTKKRKVSKGADSKGADSKGADGKGADGKGADGKGADSKKVRRVMRGRTKSVGSNGVKRSNTIKKSMNKRKVMSYGGGGNRKRGCGTRKKR